MEITIKDLREECGHNFGVHLDFLDKDGKTVEINDENTGSYTVFMRKPWLINQILDEINFGFSRFSAAIKVECRLADKKDFSKVDFVCFRD